MPVSIAINFRAPTSTDTAHYAWTSYSDNNELLYVANHFCQETNSKIQYSIEQPSQNRGRISEYSCKDFKFRRLQCLVLRSVLSVFSTCVLQSVCVHSMDFVSAINKQIKNKINKKGEQLRNAEHEQVVYTTLARASICKLANTTNPMRGQSIQHMRP